MSRLSIITSCIKYMMFIFNLFFVITGIIIISVGAAVAGLYHPYSPVLDGPYYSIPALLIAIGVIIFIVAFFGCCGAIKESYCMTLTFAVLMILVFILEISAGISGYVLRGNTYDLLSKNLLNSLPAYNKSDEITLLWDTMQTDLECCGVKNNTDWERNMTISDPAFANGSLPMSCCKPQIGAIQSANCTTESKNAYKEGCVNSLSDFIRSHAASLGATGILIGILQGVGVVFACHLAKRTKFEIS